MPFKITIERGDSECSFSATVCSEDSDELDFGCTLGAVLRMVWPFVCQPDVALAYAIEALYEDTSEHGNPEMETAILEMLNGARAVINLSIERHRKNQEEK